MAELPKLILRSRAATRQSDRSPLHQNGPCPQLRDTPTERLEAASLEERALVCPKSHTLCSIAVDRR
jgi:hypothetical protein